MWGSKLWALGQIFLTGQNDVGMSEYELHLGCEGSQIKIWF